MRRYSFTAVSSLRRVVTSLALLGATSVCSVAFSQGTPLSAPPPVRLSGLANAATVSYDAREVPTIQARSARDAFRVQGFVHAQHRFAQMDAMRRLSAGETAEILGKSAVKNDQDLRRFQGRAVARACVDALNDEEKALLDAYVEGVNAGVAALPSPPMEHAILGLKPAPWTREDCALVYLAMFHTLSRTGRHDATFARAMQQLPPDVAGFLASPISRFDCPIVPEPGTVCPPPIPGPDSINLRATTTGLRAPESDPFELEWLERAALAGSNAWAVSGARTADGRAILANDPHLQITAPILWYRCRLEWRGVNWMGLSIPGVPGIVIGTNGFVAVGFTNTTGDFEDLVIVTSDPADPSRYLVPGGSEPFGEIVETIKVRGGKDEEFRLTTTRWGIVGGSLTDAEGVEHPTVSLWVGARPDAINFDILKMSGVQGLDQAVEVLTSWCGPSQNALLADHTGRIGWVLTGWIPDRAGHDPRLPWNPLVDGEPWQSPLPRERRPIVKDPADGAIVSANHRSVPIDRCSDIGYYWANPERAHRIHQLLDGASDAAKPLAEADMLAIQLDTQVAGLEPYRAMILEAIPAEESDPALASARAAVAAWNGRADADQAAVAILSAMQREVASQLQGAVSDWCQSRTGESLTLRTVVDEPWLRVIEQRPDNWLPAEFASWNEFLLACATKACNRESGSASWGERNRAEFMSPVAEAIPKAMRGALTIDNQPQPGHFRAVRVQTPRAAASARLAVSPGHEADGILETPGGQSGDPRSPHYRSFHSEWREGVPTPLLPGDTVSTTEFLPAAG